jgi:hypothetical protein
MAMAKIVTTPEDDARHRFDQENNIKPHREIAEHIAFRHGFDRNAEIVDEIVHAIEDAFSLGERRARAPSGKMSDELRK